MSPALDFKRFEYTSLGYSQRYIKATSLNSNTEGMDEQIFNGTSRDQRLRQGSF